MSKLLPPQVKKNAYTWPFQDWKSWMGQPRHQVWKKDECPAHCEQLRDTEESAGVEPLHMFSEGTMEQKLDKE